MKKIIITALAMVLVSVAMMAQNGRNRQFNSAQMYSTMAENLAKQLKLKKEKADEFKLLYVDYQNARAKAENPDGENAEKIDVKKMTDEEANELIQKQFAASEAQIAVDKEFLPKFLEILTPVETAQVFVRRLSMQSMMGGMGGNMMRGGGMPRGGFGGGMPAGGFGGGFGGGGF